MTRPTLPLSFDYFKEHQSPVGVGPGRGRVVNEWIHHVESADIDNDDEDDEDDEDDADDDED
jgi:hypothetical protein